MSDELLNKAAVLAPSGSVLADKRYAYAEALREDGEVLAAADLFAQAAEEAPLWPAPHLARGLVLERAGALAEARDAFAKAAALDHEGVLGASLHLARVGGPGVSSMPARYVAALFDQYAPRFDSHLVEGLAYRGPQVIADLLDAVSPGRRFGPALDLGCGTGLMGAVLAAWAGPLDGIDLSAAMIDQASLTGRYRRLLVGDCVSALQACDAETYDLVVAADVLVYMGALESLFAAVARVLRPGGLFTATVQADAGEPFELGADLRFRHRPDYVRTVADQAGLALVGMRDCVTRREAGQDVPGLVFVARRP